MKIAIVGGSGRLGAEVVSAVRRDGHEARVLSRSSSEYPVDLATGAGLERALAGADAVVNAVNEMSASRASAVLAGGTARLLAAEAAAGVAHHVEIGIVGAARVPLRYYREKVDQERTVRAGAVAWTLVCATQFHEFLAWAFSSAARRHVLPGGRVPVQPVAVAEVARAVAGAAVGPPLRDVLTVAGPQVEDLGTLAAQWRASTGAHAVRIPVPGVNRLTRALRDGALTTDQPDVRGTTTFASWLPTHA